MKKVLWSVAFLVLVFAITGCGASSRTLSCSKDYSSTLPSGIKMVQDADIVFNGNKVTEINMVMKFEVSDLYASQMDTLVSSMQSSYEEQYAKYDGITVNTKKTSDSEFETLVSINYPKLSNSARVTLGFAGSEDYNVNKKQFEAQGYTCK